MSESLNLLTMKDCLQKILDGESLTASQAGQVMQDLLDDQVSQEQMAAFLIGLRQKGESAEEIEGLARVLRKQAVPVKIASRQAVDLCGTGGDASGTFNVSTVASFVVAGTGQTVAKHGNRSVSSRSGSFDVLESLGVKSVVEPQEAAHRIDSEGLGFLFAPAFHPAMRSVAALRKSLGVRTVFNFLGPMLNPAQVTRQLIGISSSTMMPKVIRALRSLGSDEVMLVRGEDGLDEISICAPTEVLHLKEGEIQSYRLDPQDFGFSLASKQDILGGSPERNAQILVDLLNGGSRGVTQAAHEMVLMNSAAALVVGGRAKNLRAGVELSQKSIATGAALYALNQARKAHVAA